LTKIFDHRKGQNKLKELILSVTHFVSERNSTGAFEFFISAEKYMKKMFLIYFSVCGFVVVLLGLVPAFFQFYLYWTNKATEDIYVIPFDAQ
jgi:hypothetical protein